MKFQVQVYQDEDDAYAAECPSIPGCVTGADSFEEALSMIQDAIKGCVETRKGLGYQLFLPTYEVEVAV